MTHLLNKWVTDANQMEIQSIGDLIFKNGIIHNFLTRSDSYFISANKGMGKTMLLTHKRSLIQKSFEDSRRSGESTSSILMIPQDSPYLDTMAEINHISKEKLDLLSDINNAKKLWIFCLQISAILNYLELEETRQELKSKVEKNIADIIDSATTAKQGRILPTYFFYEILQSVSYRELIHLFTDTQLKNYFAEIHSAVYFFIDKIDQSISSLPREPWINIQAGLIEAAWSIMEDNHHVKIYTSIRQEAFNNYSSGQKENLENSVKQIKYSEKDIEHIIDKLTSIYEGKSTLKNFINMETIKNGGGNVEEDSFKYIFRHTTGRPRELVSILSSISDEKHQLDAKLFKDIVNDKSSTLIPERFTEIKPFLNCLNNDSVKQKFYSLIKHNILTREETEEICFELNGINREYYNHLDYPKKEILHPFCDLFSCGLLGVITRSTDNQNVIKFKQPKDIVSFFPTLMPNVDLYFIHPSLQRVIGASSQESYQTFSYIVVGHNYEWTRLSKLAYKVQRECINLNNERFTEVVNEILQKLIVLKTLDVEVDFNKLISIEERNTNDCMKNIILSFQEYLFE